jgi:PAS domain S-box-containing protein
MEELARRVARFSELESDARLRELLDALPNGVIETDLEGRLIFGNQAFHQLLGATPGTLDGNPVWALAEDEGCRARLASFLRDLPHAPNGVDAHVYHHRNRKGADRYLRLDFSHKRDSGDVLIGYTAVVTDITDDRVRQDLESRLREINDHLPALIAYVDRDQRYRYTNATYRLWYGYAGDTLTGQHLRDVWGETTYRQLEPHVARVLSGEPTCFDMTVPKHPGSSEKRWVSVDYVPDIHQGEVAGFYALTRDVTAHREALELSQEAHQLLDVAFNALDVAVAYMDRDFTFIRVNESYARADEKPVSFFPGRNHFDLFPDTDNERIFRDVVETGKPYHCHARPFEYADAPDRGITHWDWSLVPVRRRDGTVFGVVLLLIDVTDRIKALEQIQESEHRFRAIFENASDAVIMANESTLELELMNPTARRWLGYGEDDFRKLTVRDIHPPESHPEVLAQFMLLAAGKIERAEDIPVLRKNGSVFRAEISAAPVELGGQRYLCGFFRDATARLETERSIRRQHLELEAANQEGAARIARQSQVIDQIHDAVVGLECDGRISSWNTGAARLLGHTAAQIEGTAFTRLLAGGEPEARLSDWLARVDREGQLEQETRLRTARGDDVEALVSLSLIRDPDGTPSGYVAYCLDISDRKASEKALKMALETARRASEAKSSFLSRMSHELRTPMNAILGFAQLLEMDDTMTEGQREHVQEIRLAGRHLLELINDILDLSRIENGRLHMAAVPVSVSELVDEVLHLAGQVAQDGGIGLESTVDCDARVMADRLRLRQILLNLVTNGIKYNRNGGQVWIHCREPLDGALRIEVEDTGVGIAESDRNRVFEPFERLHQKAGVEGVGIGLALSRQLIELMGGSIGVETRDGGGSRFWVELPKAGED